MKSVNKSVACSFSALPWAIVLSQVVGVDRRLEPKLLGRVHDRLEFELFGRVHDRLELEVLSFLRNTACAAPSTVTPVNSTASILAPPKLIRFRTSAVTEADPGAELKRPPKGATADAHPGVSHPAAGQRLGSAPSLPAGCDELREGHVRGSTLLGITFGPIALGCLLKRAVAGNRIAC